jgi:hypothetical protein
MTAQPSQEFGTTDFLPLERVQERHPSPTGPTPPLLTLQREEAAPEGAASRTAFATQPAHRAVGNQTVGALPPAFIAWRASTIFWADSSMSITRLSIRDTK